MKRNKGETSEKKAFWVFLLIVLGSLILGAVLGVLLSNLDRSGIAALGERLIPALVILVPVVFVGMNLVLLVLSVWKYRKARILAPEIEADETVYEQVDHILSYPILYGNIAMIVNLFLFSASMALGDRVEDWKGAIVALVGLVTFVFGMVWIVVVQNQTVKLVKRLNPEKRGTIFQMNFQKTWMSSCDELEKLRIYQAGFQAYRVMGGVCLGLWLVTFLSQLFFGTGVLPVLCVCLIYLAGVLTYTLTAMRLEHPKQS